MLGGIWTAAALPVGIRWVAGARSLNAATVAAAQALTAAGVQILHVYGPNNTDQVEGITDLPDYHGVAYIDGMDDAYAAADMAVCRAGAMTCAELAAVGLPAVYVPLPIGNGEQRHNAAPVVEAGGGILVDDAQLSGTLLSASVLDVITDRGRLDTMSANAAEHGCAMLPPAGGHGDGCRGEGRQVSANPEISTFPTPCTSSVSEAPG